ncbi:hypothetical protein ACJW30_10G167400 [Castanea mollissima]
MLKCLPRVDSPSSMSILLTQSHTQRKRVPFRGLKTQLVPEFPCLIFVCFVEVNTNKKSLLKGIHHWWPKLHPNLKKVAYHWTEKALAFFSLILSLPFRNHTLVSILNSNSKLFPLFAHHILDTLGVSVSTC